MGSPKKKIMIICLSFLTWKNIVGGTKILIAFEMNCTFEANGHKEGFKTTFIRNSIVRLERRF